MRNQSQPLKGFKQGNWGKETMKPIERVALEHIHSVQFSSVAQSCPTLRPHESQHARPPCPSPTPGVHSNSCVSSWLCHPAISSSVVPFSSCPQSLPASGSFPTLLMRWPKYWSFSLSISPFKEHPGLVSFRIDWLDLHIHYHM